MAEAAERARVRKTLLAVAAFALALRAVAWWATWATPPAGDEYDYFQRAARLAMGEGLPDPGGRAPGAVFFYAGVFSVFHPWAQLARGANVVVGALAVFPVFGIGRRLGGDRVGLVAAAIFAIYPGFVAFSHYLWSETLFVALVATALWATLVAAERRSLGVAVGAGVAWGAAALTREAGLLAAPACALWLALAPRFSDRGEASSSPGRGRDVAMAAMLLAGFAVTLAPWTVYINEPGLPFTAVTRTSYMNLQAGNSHRAPGFEIAHYTERGADRAEREQRSAELAFAYIAERGAAWPFEKIAREVPRFFAPESFGARRARTPAGDPGGWGYRFSPDFLDTKVVRWTLATWAIAAYVGVLLAGAVGSVLTRHHSVSTLLALFVTSQLAPAVVTFSMTRFRLAAMLAFVAGTAALAVTGKGDWAAASKRRRIAAVAVVAAFAIVLVAGAFSSGKGHGA